MQSQNRRKTVNEDQVYLVFSLQEILRLYDRYKLIMMQTFDIMNTQISDYQFIQKDVYLTCMHIA